MEISRQQQRAALRVVSSAALKRLISLPRRLRRIGARAYANQAYRDNKQIPTPRWHRYNPIVLNQTVRQWIQESA